MAEKEEVRHESKVELEAKEESKDASENAPGETPTNGTVSIDQKEEEVLEEVSEAKTGAPPGSDPADVERKKQAARMIYEKVYDESVGRFYYYNARDGTSSWDLPPEFEGDDSFLLTPRSRELMVLKMDAGTWKTSETMTEDEAARTIQGLYRRRQARILIVRAIQSMYEKVWDENSGRFFYFNKRTGESIWTKPPLLGYYDDVPLTPRSQALVRAAEAKSREVYAEDQASSSKLDDAGYYSQHPPMQQAGTKSDSVPEVDEIASVNSGIRSTGTLSKDGYLISSDSEGDFVGQSWESKDGSYDGSMEAAEEFKMDADMRLRQLKDFLADNELEEYEEALIDDGFDDMEAVLAILEEDIDAIGFTIADKRKLMNAVEKFRATADLEFELSDDDSDLERRDEDEIDEEIGSDAEDAEDEIRRLRGEGSEYSVSEGGYPEGEADLEGVTIETLFPGDGENFPQPGQIVRMHYKAFIKGSQNSFEDSRLRGRVFEFKLDAAQVVPGLDEAMRTMSFGTKARVTLESSVAYGDKGHPPVIPPNADLIFEVQLIKSYYAERSIDDLGMTET